MQGDAVTLNLTNAYAMNTEKVTAKVLYNDGLDKKFGAADLSFNKNTGSCTVIFKAAGGEAAVSSVTLLKDGIPFEWLDYASPQETAGGELNLDVNDNEFANGAYTAGTDMKVANPRHLDNVRHHLQGGSFVQIADIDFAGSCGIINTVTIEKSDTGTQISAQRTDIDTEARFYGEEVGSYGWFYGWQPIGGESSQFIGTYDGGGFSIANVVCNSVDASSSHALSGLFGIVGDNVNDTTIKNVKLADSCSFCSSYLSALVCENFGKLEISKCESAGECFSTQYCAGMLGQMYDHRGAKATISGCKVNGQISGQWCGGMMGYFSHGIVNLSGCAFNGTLTTNAYLGGLVYYCGLSDSDECTIKNCAVNGVLSIPPDSGSSSSKGSGGFIGHLQATLKLSGENSVSCTMEYVTNSTYIGGVVGYSNLSEEALRNSFLDTSTTPPTLLVTVNENTVHDQSEANKIGTYCGYPWINNLNL